MSRVSAVLANRADCWASDQTRQKVYDAARALGYKPNLAARALRGGATDTIGLITVAFNIEVTSRKIEAFDAAAKRSGYVAMMTFHPNDPAEENRLIRKLRDRQVDGIVVYPTESGGHEEILACLADGVALVTVDGFGRTDLRCDDVSTDFYEIGRMQADHLYDSGKRRLAQIKTYPSCYTKDQLRDGFVDRAAELGLPPVRLLNWEEDPFAGSLVSPKLTSQADEFLNRNIGEIDAVASHDTTAVAVVNAAVRRGRRVPEDLYIIGADDSTLASNCVIPLTSVGQSARDVGRMAFELVSGRIADPGQPHRHFKAPLTLVRRASTGAGS
jgi:LacI family transcriptional regulator